MPNQPQTQPYRSPLKTVEVLKIACPQCKAAPGEWCRDIRVSFSGGKRNHAARFERFRLTA